MNSHKSEFAVYVGRFSPFHLGHQAQISAILKEHGDNHLVIVGSSTAERSEKNPFTLKERVSFIREVFPKVRILGMPDYSNDCEWLYALDDIVDAVSAHRNTVTFYGGKASEVAFYGNRKVVLNDRNGNEMPNVSATEVRRRLTMGEKINGLVDPKIVTMIESAYTRFVQWQDKRL